MIIRSYEQNLQNYSAFSVHKNLMLYAPPMLVVFGTIGNVLAFIILTRRAMRNYSPHIYLAVLAVADTLVLFVGQYVICLITVTCNYLYRIGLIQEQEESL